MISDAEMVTLSMMQALPGYTSEIRWLRFARKHLRHLFGLSHGNGQQSGLRDIPWVP